MREPGCVCSPRREINSASSAIDIRLPLVSVHVDVSLCVDVSCDMCTFALLIRVL